MKKNSWKHVLQLGVIALIAGFILKVFFGGAPANVESYCPFGGLESLATYLNTETLACSMSVIQITMGVMLAVCVILFSRLFCGYVCPLGTVSEWLGKWGRKMKINHTIPTASVADRALRIVKYILLFWIFYMTLASSELFCKNFDPYYAVATGFQGEITVWMSVISLLLLVVGNLTIRMFWCKYICPLGALSIIFKFILTFIAILLLTVLLNYTGVVHISVIWALGITSIITYFYEIILHKSKTFPLLNIVRDNEKCNHCGVCTKKCPHAINLTKSKVIKDVECTLCGECIASCHQQALSVNGKTAFRWIPAVLVVVLFFFSIWTSSHWELPTISERWGDTSKHLVMFEKEGMRTVKCYGSSKAFSAKMQHVPGVYGVTTYVNRFAVQVYYDPQETTQEEVEKAMFTPTKRKLETPPAEIDKLKIITLGVENLFDRMDIVYLGNIIRSHGGFYGIVSEYDCPVRIKLYMDINKQIDKKELKSIVETPEYDMPQHGGTVQKIKCDYRLISLSEKVDTIGRLEFLQEMFPKSGTTFKQADETYKGKETAVYEIEFPQLDLPMYQNMLPYFANFISVKPGIIGFETALKIDVPVIRITYAKEAATEEDIWNILQEPQWTIHYSDGTTEDINAPYSFEQPGTTLSPDSQSAEIK